MGRHVRGDDQYRLELQRFPGSQGCVDVPQVNGIERAAENADARAPSHTPPDPVINH
jgi:hypothetical protein